MINTSFGSRGSGILTVSQLNFYIKSLIESDLKLSGIFISGEISNLTDHYRSGHIYLSLKDEKSVIRAVIFSGNASRLKFQPENGMRVIARGRVSLYEATGQYQLYIDDLMPQGAGALAVAFEQLKSKLDKEGLFDKAAKKAIPKYPETVGVITSPTGAAIEDIKNIISRRWPPANILLYPSLVQGDGAEQQLIEGLEYFSKNKCADVVIIGRGGGSAEDLWVFNSEKLARAVYGCQVPVISAVGHETDFTICDFVADLRAATPSEAAQRAVPDILEVRAQTEQLAKYLRSTALGNLMAKSAAVEKLKLSLEALSPIKEIEKRKLYLESLGTRFEAAVQKSLNEKERRLWSLGDRLSQLDPVRTLQRGYAVAEKEEKTLRSVSQVKSGDMIKITLYDGSFSAEVK